MLRLADYATPQICTCGALAKKQLSAPAVQGDFAGYECPVSGRWIEGRRAHEENLKRTGCRVLEPGESKAAMQRVEREEAALEASIESTADRFIAELSADKRGQLCNEVASGITANVERH